MMATKATFDFTIVPNKAAKSSVWAHFGFVKRNGELDKKKVACRLCYSEFKYSGNTTNLTDHLKRKHPTFAKHAAATPSEVKFKSLTSPYHPATALHTSKSEATESTQQPQPGSFHSILVPQSFQSHLDEQKKSQVLWPSSLRRTYVRTLSFRTLVSRISSGCWNLNIQSRQDSTSPKLSFPSFMQKSVKR